MRQRYLPLLALLSLLCTCGPAQLSAQINLDHWAALAPRNIGPAGMSGRVTNYGGGIYRSLDGGKTWKHMGLEATRHIHRVIVHPTNPDIVYAGAMGNMWYPNEERGVFRTTNGGKTWEKILYVDDGTGIADMIIDPRRRRQLGAQNGQARPAEGRPRPHRPCHRDQ